MESVFGQVPFLNGGLFEKTNLDERDGVMVPDDAIQPVLTELFEKFNFTVMESTPFDIEVAVDPEMLGKVFEELVTGRHESGSYYTPRPVVSFMCREALKGYLEGRDIGLSSEAVAQFVDRHDTEDVQVAQARRVAAALEQITVVDPACGSGAYLLGMMQELIELQTTLFNAGVDAKALHDLKLEIIQRNLYGVDNDEFAVNIAMLRMWLSLAIEYEGAVPEPLPNLDFKVVCGDSLLGPDPSPTAAPNPDPTSPLRQTELFDYQIAGSSLGALKADYMRKRPGPAKTSLRDRIENIERDLRDALGGVGPPQGSVDWRIAFAEVFAARGGFDVVIANPPYVRHEQIGELKPDLAKRFPSVYQGTADILVYFFARAIELMRPGGWIVFITSNGFTKRGYGKKLRAHLSETLSIDTVIDFGEIKIFDATVEVFILVGRNHSPDTTTVISGHNLYPLLARRLGRGANVELSRAEMSRLPQDLADEISIFPQARLDSSEWRIEDESINRLFERLMNQGTPLGEFVDGRIYYGIKTGLNKAFVIDRYKRDELIDADPRSAEIIKPWLSGREIKRWKAQWAGSYAIHVPWTLDITTYPAIRQHLSAFKHGLAKRPEVRRGVHPWFSMSRWAAEYYEEFEHPKIIWPEIARLVRFAYDTSGSYMNKTSYSMPSGSMWLLAILNSTLIEFILCQITSSLRGGFLLMAHDHTTRLPIVTPDSVLQHRLDSIASAGIAGEPVDTDELNDIVRHLYDLSPADIALINDWFQRRSLTS